MDTEAIKKIINILRNELAPSLEWDDRFRVYSIADSLESLLLYLRINHREIIKEVNSVLEPSTIYEVLGGCK